MAQEAIDGRLVLTTPEGVLLRLPLAGPGSRAVAALVDTLIAGLLLTVLAVTGVGVVAAPRDGWRPTDIGWLDAVVRGGARLALPLVVLALVVPLVGELLGRGRSLGGLVAGVRVVQLDGTPAPAASLVVRGVLRVVDGLPGTGAVGLLAMTLSPLGQTLGDRAVGTVVVRVPPPVTAATASASLVAWSSVGPPTAQGLPAGVGFDVGHWGVDRLGPGQRELLQAFCARRWTLAPGVRASFAAWLAATLHEQVTGVPAGLGDEVFLDGLLLRVTTG